jgi:hypothetical protein
MADPSIARRSSDRQRVGGNSDRSRFQVPKTIPI